MTKKVTMAVVATCLAVMPLVADTENVGGVAWTYTVANGVASLGQGSVYMSDPVPMAVPSSTSGAISIPSQLGGYPVTGIGNYAFYGCIGITSITIPDSVTSIGNGAFSGCSGLMAINVSASSGFSSANGLLLSKDGKKLLVGVNGNVIIPNSVTSIGASAFDGFCGLTSVAIPNSVGSIGNSAFSGCNGLASVTIPNSVTNIGSYAFRNCSGLMSIAVSAGNTCFSSANGLLLSKDGKNLIAGVNGNVVIPDSVTNIGNYAFYGCSGLTSVTIPNGVTRIGMSAFNGCSGLTSTTIPNGITYIDDGVFYGCSGLTSVTIPNSVRSIRTAAFGGCSGLTSVTIPGSVESIEDAFVKCTSLTSVVFEEGLDGRTLNLEESFCDCTNLTSVVFCKGMIIGEELFDGCTKLQSIDIPEVRRIESGAFRGCGVTNITITGVNCEICHGAFAQCTNLVEVTFGAGIGGIGDVFHIDTPFRRSEIYGALKRVSIGPDVRYLDYYTFANCTVLECISVDPNNEYYKSVEGNLLSKDGEVFFFGVGGNVTIPSSVGQIMEYAFFGRDNLITVDIAGSEYISNLDRWTVFAFCGNLTSFSVAAENRYYKSANGMLLTDNWGEDDWRLIAGVNGDVVIPDCITYIDSYVFCGRSGLTSVTVPNSVTRIDEEAFVACNGLMSFAVQADNSGYSSTNGLLLSKNGKKLIAGVNGNVVIPDSVKSVGRCAFYGHSGLTSVTIPACVTNFGAEAFYGCSGLTNIVFGAGVTSIDCSMFYDCSGLMSATIPESVTNFLGSYTFDNSPFYNSLPDGLVVFGKVAYKMKGTCPAVVSIPDGVTSIASSAFSGCSGLTGVTIPNSVTSIGSSAFHGCSGLTSVTIPNSVTSIGSSAFSGCSGLTSVTIPNSVTSIGGWAFSGCSRLADVTIPNSVTSIVNGAFSGCASVTIPDNVTIIGDSAFYGVRDITLGSGMTNVVNKAFGSNASFTVDPKNPSYSSKNGMLLDKDGKRLILGVDRDAIVPNGVETISAGAFSNCRSLTRVTIPNSVTNIGDSAFSGCWSLDNVVIPDGVVSIGCNAFDSCNSLSSVVLPNGIVEIAEYSFRGCAIRNVIIPQGVRHIRKYAFDDCYFLENVIMPDGLISIGDNAFSSCISLESVIVPDSVVHIGHYAFESCSGSVLWMHGGVSGGHNGAGLGKVVIGSGVTNIGNYAFAYNKSLTGVFFNADAPVIGSGCFYGVTDTCTAYVKSSSTGWGVDIPGTWKGIRIEYVDVPPADWIPVVKEDTMVVYAMVYDWSRKAAIESDGALLAAFDSAGECRGVTEIIDGPLGRLFLLSVGVESGTESGLVLKVWNPDDGVTTEIPERISCNAEKQIGEIFDPYVFEIGYVDMPLSLAKGWNWISSSLVLGNPSVGSVFAGCSFANGDVVKTSNGSATYYGGAWYPTNFSINPGIAYVVKKSTDGVETATLSGTPMEDGIAVNAGWNWIGPTVMGTQVISSVTHSGGFANNDTVKAASVATAYYGGAWYPGTFTMEQGKGYKARLANAGTLRFAGGATMLSVAPAQLMGAALFGASAGPDWKPVAQEDTLIAYLRIGKPDGSFVEADGSVVAAFASGGECRGVAEIEDDGPFGKLYQLSVGVTSDSESGFTLKVWDAASGRVYDVEGTLACNTDKRIGQMDSPAVRSAVADAIPALAADASAAAVTNAIAAAGFADEGVKDAIGGNAEAYGDFKAWAASVKSAGGSPTAAGEAAVVANTNAATAWLLGAERLFANAPEIELDVESVGEEGGASGTPGLAVTVRVMVKDGAEAVKCAAEKVRDMFEATCDLGDWDGASRLTPAVTAEPDDGATMRFTVRPGDGTANRAFLRIRK